MHKTVVTVLVTFVATSLLWIGGAVALYLHFFGGEPPFRVSVRSPERVFRGEEFRVELDVENAGPEPITVASVDVYDSFLAGLELIDSEPAYRTRDHTLNFETLWLERPLAPDETLSVRLRLRAVESGLHGGHIEVCTRQERCTTVYAAVGVLEQDAGD